MVQIPLPKLIESLIILDLPDSGRFSFEQGHQDTWMGNLFPAEQCARQTLVGFEGDLNLMQTSINLSGSVKIYKGFDAYRRLVQLAAGILDAQPGEKDILDKFQKKWDIFRKEQPARAILLAKVVEAVIADQRMIRSNVFRNERDGLKPSSKEPIVCACGMLDVKHADQIVVIGEKEGITNTTLQALDMKAKHANIAVTHPDPQELARIKNDVRQLYAENKLHHATVHAVSYDKALQTARTSDFIFNCQPLGEWKHDESLMEAWVDHENPNTKIVHLKGVPRLHNATPDYWENLRDAHTLFRSDIDAYHQKNIEHNRECLHRAETVLANAVSSRMMNLKPAEKHILRDTAEYVQMIVSAAERAEAFRRQAQSPGAER